MTTTNGGGDTSGIPSHCEALTELDAAWRAPSAGERLAAVRRGGAALRERIIGSGRAVAVRTFDVSQAPYPTKFGFSGAALSPAPYLFFMNRANLVQFETKSGEVKNLLFNPTDAARSAETPFFRRMQDRMGDFLSKKVTSMFRRPKPHEQLPAVGLRPEDIDYIAFDHLHTQDLREILGTDALRPYFPRAKMLIWRPELDIFRDVHPLQDTWYVRDGVAGVPRDRFIVCDGDVLLGKGVALVRTPGHTVGNWSLVLHTDRGVWAVSENGISCDSYAPEASRIPGLRGYAREQGVEVVLNSNTLEMRNEQYTSMVLEKTLVDRCPDAPEFYQHFPSSELIGSPLAPGLQPTYRHREIVSGELRRIAVAAQPDRAPEHRAG